MTEKEIKKLSKKVQEYIRLLISQREQAVSALSEFCNRQTESSLYAQEFVCDQTPPSTRINYIQSNKLYFENEFELKFDNVEETIDIIFYGTGHLFVLPISSNRIKISKFK